MSYAVLRNDVFTGTVYENLTKSDYDLHTAQSEKLTELESGIPNTGSHAAPVYRAPTATELANFVTTGDLPSLFSVDENTKLANIETAATADLGAGEIKALYLSNANTNNFEDADEAKLDGIEAGATADQTDAEIKAAYENNANTNEFSDAEKTTLGYLTATSAINLNDIADNATGAIPLTQKGAANGVASLDAGGKLSISQLPTSAQTLEGEWNPATNTPTLADGTGDAGATYIVGSGHDNVVVNLGSGAQSFTSLDQIVYTTGGQWLLIPRDTQLTDAQVVGAIGNVADTNTVTDAELAHLNAIEAGATADQTGAEIVTLAEAEADKNFLSDSQQTKLDGLPVNAQEVFFTPTISSPSIAATVDQGQNISYRLMSTAGDSKFMITDAGGTGIVVNYESGVMFGGATATAGSYTIKCRAGNVFGISNEFDLSWSVSAAGGGSESNLILSSMSNSNYNVTFTPTSVPGVMHMNGNFDATETGYKVFSYNAGSSYYVVMFKTGANLWIAFETATDPATLTNGASAGETNGVIVTANSDTQDGKSVPDEGDSNVDYS